MNAEFACAVILISFGAVLGEDQPCPAIVHGFTGGPFFFFFCYVEVPEDQ